MALRRKTSGLYASGIGSPFRADSDGGLALSEGDAYVRAQVFAAVNVNTSDNPFQDLGVGESMIFENAEDPAWRRTVRERIVTQFKALETNNLARLVRVDFATRGNESGDFEMTVVYVNLETNAEQSAAFGVAAGNVGLRAI